MHLRHVEDRRTLVWAFVLMPGVPALAYWHPALVPWLVPLSLYLSYCAGVLAHNHNHRGVFVARRANLFYGAWLSIFYGFPLFAWIPTHNQNHHQYLNGPGDATRTTRHATRDTLLAALTYPVASGRFQFPLLAAYVGDALRRRRFLRVALETCALVFAHLGLAWLALHWHGVRTGALVYLATVGLPAFTATYWMMLTNYLQHVGCDSSSPDAHSRNFTSPFWNYFVFDNGLHTVHHEHPGTHWSRYRALHDARASRIPAELCHPSLFGYFARAYLVPGRRRSVARAELHADALHAGAARRDDAELPVLENQAP